METQTTIFWIGTESNFKLLIVSSLIRHYFNLSMLVQEVISVCPLQLDIRTGKQKTHLQKVSATRRHIVCIYSTFDIQ